MLFYSKDQFFNESWVDHFGPKEKIESWLMSELVDAFLLARKSKRSTFDEQLFETRLFENLLKLRDDIIEDKYTPGHGIAFIVHDPVIREIFAAPFRDRVIHHLLYNGIAEWWDRRLIDDCYSCRPGKGTLYGILRLAYHIRSASENFTKRVYVIKLDVQGYFMSLPHEGLFERVCWGLDRQFPNGGPIKEIYKMLWKKVIFDEPTIGVHRRGSLKEWRNLPRSKSLFNQPKGRGIVIGNLSSQLLSNIYLDQLDRYIKYQLGYKHYGRYVDDFFIVVTEDELPLAKRNIKNIRDFLLSIGLTLHPKKIFIQPAEHGVPFLGAVIYPGRIVPGKRLTKNYRSALAKFEAGKVSEETIISYMGICKHLNAESTQMRIWEQFGLDYNPNFKYGKGAQLTLPLDL